MRNLWNRLTTRTLALAIGPAIFLPMCGGGGTGGGTITTESLLYPGNNSQPCQAYPSGATVRATSGLCLQARNCDGGKVYVKVQYGSIIAKSHDTCR